MPDFFLLLFFLNTKKEHTHKKTTGHHYIYTEKKKYSFKYCNYKDIAQIWRKSIYELVLYRTILCSRTNVYSQVTHLFTHYLIMGMLRKPPLKWHWHAWLQYENVWVLCKIFTLSYAGVQSIYFCKPVKEIHYTVQCWMHF